MSSIKVLTSLRSTIPASSIFKFVYLKERKNTVKVRHILQYKLEKSPHCALTIVEEQYPFFTILLLHKFVIQEVELKLDFSPTDFRKFGVRFLNGILVIHTFVTCLCVAHMDYNPK